MSAARVVLPETVTDVAQLEDLLSEPTSGVIDTLAALDGDIMVLGAAGKMGPSLSRMARRASDAAGTKREVLAVSRFSSADAVAQFEEHGIRTIKCDLLDPQQLAALAEVPNIVYMAGMKFGSTGQEAMTWAMNAVLPAFVCQKFAASRIVAFSTGNIYGLQPMAHGGALESTPFDPMGDYAMSCVGRERIFEHYSRTLGIPTAMIRLNYAIDLRYGVLYDIATKVWAEQPVDVAMGVANVIWQGDANAMTLQAFGQVASPPFALNVAGPELLSVRRLAQQFGELMGKPVTIEGNESPNALVTNGQLGHRLFGYPRVSVQTLLRWIADWVMRGGASLGKPTHFEVRDGKF